MMGDIEFIDDLIMKLQEIRREAGRNVKLNLSVMQEDRVPFSTFYEDRKLCNHVELVGTGPGMFVELYA